MTGFINRDLDTIIPCLPIGRDRVSPNTIVNPICEDLIEGMRHSESFLVDLLIIWVKDLHLEIA